MKKLLIILMLLITSKLGAKPLEVTIYVEDSYKPYSYEEDGDILGIFVDVLRAAFEKMPDYKLKLVSLPWNRARKAVKDGSGIALGPVLFHGHDWQFLHPYSLWVYQENIIVVCNEKAQKKNRKFWPRDFLGLEIGSVLGYDGWGGIEFHRMVRFEEINLQEADNVRQNILKLEKGRVDCILAEELVYNSSMRELKKKGLLKASRKSLKFKKTAFAGVEHVYLGYSKTAQKIGKYPFQYEFMQAFDTQIHLLRNSGKIDKIIENYSN